uniref:DRIM domain-containing protein n=1 Tax=Angiostrongylus cantonensis TaxID=6313 RepID=A0A158PBP4_ANGCA
MELLLKNLHDPECKSTEPFCELLTALIRDLKDDCCEDIWNVLEALINVLDFGERDVQSVEVAFYSLSLIVRLMWKALIRDLNSCFVRFIPLLGSSRSYARRFAAECFSFVIRKSKNLMKISGQIVEQAYRVQDNRLRVGCAELFFHVPRGIAGAFHSTANEKICSIISGILHLPNSDVREYGVTILEMFVQLLVQYVRKGVKADLSPLEVALLNMLEDLNSMELVTCMVRLLRLCFVQRKWVNMFSSNTKLLSVITKLLSSSFFEINSMFIEFLSECVLKVFPSSEWGHSIGCMCSTLVSKTGDLSAVFHFFNNAINLVYFDEHLMPVVGKFSAVVFAKEHGFIEQLLNLYSTVCLNKRPFKDIICGVKTFMNVGISVRCLIIFDHIPLDVLQVLDLSIHMPVRQHIIQHIQLLCSIEKSVVSSMLVIWPWIRSNDDNVADVDNVMEYLNNLIRGTDYSLETSQTALIAVSSLFRVDQSRLGEIDICQVEEFVRGMNCCESALRLYHYYLVANEDLSTIITLKRVCDVLLPCYFHPNSSVRKTALEILSSFNIGVEGAEINTSIGVLSKQDSVFGILLAAECCDIVDSRARLLHFTKLTFGSHRRLLPEASGTTFDHVILRVALAQFFVQFTKLWSSMYGFLESFARGMDIDEFWSVITEVFDHLNAGCRDQCSLPSVASILPLCDRNDRADYYSARIQVLKFIGNVWDLAQRRTRILSPILLEIYGIEYLPFITERITSWQQRLPETTSILGTDSQKNEYSEKRDQYLTVTKTLCTFLDIYAKFTDAKSVYLESKIRDMYDHLLISGNDMVQKSVMACIFSYKDKALLPYQENFERLLNEKLFREQLVLFSINENEGNSIIHLDHRRAVMYILLRLLYGKLWAHTKRNVVESRRAAIFRYLGGCRPDELLDFLKILFGPILEVIGIV